MYYEEKYDNGVWYWRGTPDGEWIEMGARMLSEKLAAAQRELAAYREPTIEDAMELVRGFHVYSSPKTLELLKQLGFVRKVQP